MTIYPCIQPLRGVPWEWATTALKQNLHPGDTHTWQLPVSGRFSGFKVVGRLCTLQCRVNGKPWDGVALELLAGDTIEVIA